MTIKFIIKEKENTRLILLYTGWSTGPELYQHIQMPGWDVAVVYGYNNLNLNLDFLDSYYTIYVFAWSMGVWGAEQTLPPHKITAAIAVNGTPYPMDNDYGIPENIFRGTAENLNPRNLTKFRRRMMPDSEHMKLLFPDIPTENASSSLKEELDFIIAESQRPRPNLFPWIRAYIGRNDHIFPPENMFRFWHNDPDVHIIENDNHHYMPMERVIRNVIADTFKVSSRFTKAETTYESNAIAQKLTAFRLARMISENLRREPANILEVGPGTGNLTYALASYFKPDCIDFVDITKTGPFGIALEENYHIADAEIWIANNKHPYDLITSASAIQWFANLPRFFSDCARLLKPNGLLAISTFATGNLEELDKYRTSPIIYKSAEWYAETLEPLFDIVKIEEDEIKIEFESRRHLLIHLKNTGVGGSASSTSNPFANAPDLRALTFRPLYILAYPKNKK